MSYRFYLFDAGSGGTVAAAHAWLEAQEQAQLAGEPIRGTAPAWLDPLRTALGSRHADLQPEGEATDENQAPMARLADADDGVELMLYGDHVAVTIPFWHSGERAEHVLLRVFDYLKTVSDITGFMIYDPQLDRRLTLESDLPRVVQRYSGTTRSLRQSAAQHQQRRTD